jgi:hypothetical protein
VFTGFYKNFASLSAEDKQAIFVERTRLGVAPPKSRRGARISAAGKTKTAIKAKNKQVDTLQRKIASLKAKVAAAEDGKKRDVGSDGDDDSIQDNAGDQFGGRSAKKYKKEKK